jgi:hypothetical protein
MVVLRLRYRIFPIKSWNLTLWQILVDCTEVRPNAMLLTDLNCEGDVVDCTEVVPNTMLCTAQAGLD